MSNNYVINGKDLIYKISNREIVSIVNKKYSSLFKEDELNLFKTNPRMVEYDIPCVISDSDYKKLLNYDVKAIEKASKALSGDEITIIHGYTPEGEGFYTLLTENEKRYVSSVYRLCSVGGAWSYITWRGCLFTQALLTEYLTTLKENLTKSFKKKSIRVHMDIKPLYLLWIKEDIKHDRENLPTDYLAYKDNFIKEWSEYASIEDPGCIWYSTEEGELYFAIEQVLRDAQNTFYGRREEFEKADMWKAVSDVIGDLQSLKFKHRPERIDKRL